MINIAYSLIFIEGQTMNDNPLKKYFRQPALYLKLPTQGKWYTPNDIDMSHDSEVAVYGLSALDDIMLNTPDAMLNGLALEKVISNCVPDIKNVKKIFVPDLEAIFLGIKMATNDGKFEVERTCPKCKHENNFEVNCAHILDTISYIDDSDTVVSFNDQLIINIQPYTFEMRQMFMQKQFEEDRTLRLIDEQNKNLDEFQKARILAESVEKLSKITFELVSKSIIEVHIKSQNITVSDPMQIAEWLMNINKSQADTIINSVNSLNMIGPNKKVPAVCSNCNHQWDESLNFDPISFFGKRS